MDGNAGEIPGTKLLSADVTSSLLPGVNLLEGTKSVPRLSDHPHYRWSSLPLGGAVMSAAEDHQKGSPMKKEHKAGSVIASFAAVAVIAVTASGCKATSAGSTSPLASFSAIAPAASPSPSPSPTATSSPSPASAAARPTVKPRRRAAPARPAPSSSKAVAPPLRTATATAPAAAATTPSGCYPLTNGGNCYEPGEFCRNRDHGATGVAGDGKAIVCEDNDGWRWEPR